jgi:hypothetical protein
MKKFKEDIYIEGKRDMDLEIFFYCIPGRKNMRRMKMLLDLF